jgi:hypothetical protein
VVTHRRKPLLISQKQDATPDLIRNGLLLGVLLGFALMFLGGILVPATPLLGLMGAGLILGIYGLVSFFGVPRIRPEILHWASGFGLVAGAIFAGEILLEYVFLPQDNTPWGLVEFGSVFFLYFLSGLWTAYRSGHLRQGSLAAIASAMISTLIWLIVLWITFYAFRGTARQTSVFMAEGNYDDFQKSGMADFNVFIMGDFLGATFYLLLLGPILAAVLGTVGGLLGKGLGSISRRIALNDPNP